MTAIAGGARPRTAVVSTDVYTWMFLACVLAAFLGFTPTFWQPLAGGQFKANPVVFFHGAAFFTWTLYALFQASLVPARRIALHRAVGLAGISLATLITVLGLLVALNSQVAHGRSTAGDAFLIVPLRTIATFAILFTAAIANIRRPEWHKRLMLLTTVTVLNAPLARPFLAWVFKLGPTATPAIWMDAPGAYVGYLIMAAGMVHDWRTRGRVHAAYLIVAPILLLEPLVVIGLGHTAAWLAFAKLYAGLLGTPG